ncbi:hypothetical protein IWQ62_003068 [Dispira parvispora]|uniref:Methanethiol oxidase n=1 Tax=Dispira parvispora TaxID=1520584 RepID=A0A9W8AUF9_9FUNG|nr:hypothetical protein IWQ62_003068 [Dispira parvispora]
MYCHSSSLFGWVTFVITIHLWFGSADGKPRDGLHSPNLSYLDKRAVQVKPGDFSAIYSYPTDPDSDTGGVDEDDTTRNAIQPESGSVMSAQNTNPEDWTLEQTSQYLNSLAHPQALTGIRTYVYVWCSPQNKQTHDFLAVFGLSNAFHQRLTPRLVSAVPVPTKGNEAHHLYLSRDGKSAFAGGLLSARNNQAPNFFFDLHNPKYPRYIKSSKPQYSTAADAAYPLDNGGFLVTMMGGTALGKSGRVVEYDKEMNLVGEYPREGEELPDGFYPHGISVKPGANFMITTDFIDPFSTLLPTDGITAGNTVRIWNYTERRIVNTVTLGDNIQGVMDVAFVSAKDCSHCAIVSSTSDGKLYVVDPTTGEAHVSYNSGDANAGFHVMHVNRAGTRLWVSAANSGNIYMFDTTSARRLRLLAKVSVGSRATPHFITLTPDESMLIVTDYFLDQQDFGVVHSGGDKKMHFLQIAGNRMDLLPSMDLNFKKLFWRIGQVNPHGVAVLNV